MRLAWNDAGGGGKLTGKWSCCCFWARETARETIIPADHKRTSPDELVPVAPPPLAAPGSPSPGAASEAPSINPPADDNGSLQAECERLRKRVQELEAECGSYHRSLTVLLRERCAQTDTSTDADLDRLADEALRLRDFDDELSQLLQER